MTQQIKLYNGKVIINFDENRHFFTDEKGKHILSVTACTGIIDKSQPLMYWAVKKAKEYLLDNWLIDKKYSQSEIINLLEEASKQHRIFKEEAAMVGDLIHNWVSQWILGKKPEMPDNESVVNGITAFLKFQKKHKLKWVESERFIYSKRHKYAGILDAIAQEGKKLTLIDFKSSSGIYPEMYLQCAGYKIAYEEETGKKIDKRIIIKFGKEDGNFEVRELDEDKKDEIAFLSCLNLKRRLKEVSTFNGNGF